MLSRKKSLQSKVTRTEGMLHQDFAVSNHIEYCNISCNRGLHHLTASGNLAFLLVVSALVRHDIQFARLHLTNSFNYP